MQGKGAKEVHKRCTRGAYHTGQPVSLCTHQPLTDPAAPPTTYRSWGMDETCQKRRQPPSTTCRPSMRCTRVKKKKKIPGSDTPPPPLSHGLAANLNAPSMGLAMMALRCNICRRHLVRTACALRMCGLLFGITSHLFGTSSTPPLRHLLGISSAPLRHLLFGTSSSAPLRHSRFVV